MRKNKKISEEIALDLQSGLNILKEAGLRVTPVPKSVGHFFLDGRTLTNDQVIYEATKLKLQRVPLQRRSYTM